MGGKQRWGRETVVQLSGDSPDCDVMTGYEPPAPPPERPDGPPLSWGPPPSDSPPPAWGPPADAPPPAGPPPGGGGYGPPGGGGYGPPPGYGYPGGTGGYMPPGRGPAGPQPPSYLVGAILATLFCCLPFGVVSIVYAAQVSSKYNAGDFYGATESSKKAKAWMIASILVGLVIILIYVGLGLAAASSSVDNTPQYQYP